MTKAKAVQTDRIRATFVARFGEDQAAIIEQAAQGHYAENLAQFINMDPPLPHPHETDDFGSSPFRYWFLLAIGHQCVTRFAGDHGITVPEQDLRDWGLTDGELGDHEGDIPDYIALFVGLYRGWVRTDD